ncbi:sigma 54-interacting transcriptional regulator [Marinisporobacter balticus]|uniref:Sigma-54 interacting transcriptional regulator n=1 Tax=Marinisporobacter balticus TaxID=2018667 RepID=A0A4R2KWI5_9FIRM|nr:sigma 54-interacting transcriptional regulator [Marinisporobacter balticus]TCO71055.1 sigma-54 interacting transcriptional regulator [Marinisporobacter balticus]
MIFENHLFEQIINNIDVGIIYIDKNHNIKQVNQYAQEALGIIIDPHKSHLGGKINPGDIVVIVDNHIGNDDGGLTPEDLKVININDKDIKTNDTLIGIGIFKNAEIKPIYKHCRNLGAVCEFKIKTNHLGFHIEAYIDSIEKENVIIVNGIKYSIKFFNSIGHIVVIDKISGNIKFFQAKGYTVRKENIRRLLQGNTFLPKGDKSFGSINLHEKKLEEIVECDALISDLDLILQEKLSSIQNKFYELNQRPALCSIHTIKNNHEVAGAFITLNDASEPYKMLKNRNAILSELEKIQNNYITQNYTFPPNSFQDFVGNSAKINEVKYLAYKASSFKLTVIITGESGTGKSQLAREIHRLYKGDSPFIEVNCSSIPHNLFESELFGYVGGAFTGALPSGKDGYFQMANSGTIFLDEVGEIPNEIQVKLLHVLQNRKFYKIGSSKPTNIDVRIIAATNMDLRKEVQNGSFREDLYYRLNVFPIKIPPLRERTSDIYILINNILKNLSNFHNISYKQLSGEALNKLLNYSWPGNVRELENTLERAMTLCETNILYPEHIYLEDITSQNNILTLKNMLDIAEKRALEDAIIQYNHNKNLIIKNLNISKSSFYEKIKRYNIKF